MAGEDRQDPGGDGLNEAPLPAHRCPLCGGPNACVPARSGSFSTPCWCRTVRFDAALLARVAEAQQGRACICAACAGAAAAAVP